MQKIKLGQGLGLDRTIQTPNGDGTFGAGFVSTDAITATVWAGDSTTALATPSVAWGGTVSANGTTTVYTAAQGAPLTLWTISFQPADTATLAPGLYRLQVIATHGRPALLFDGLVEVLAVAGSAADTADLATFTYVETLLAPLRLRETEREMITLLKAEASDTIRKWCGQRDFTRQTYTEEHTAELNGQVALRQMPVNNVTRIRGYPQTILTITAQPGAFSHAWVSYTTTGDWYSNNLVFTGLVLNAESNGTVTSAPLSFATYPTVGQLAAAVSATAGFTAQVQGAFGGYATTDLSPPGGVTAQGAKDDDGAELVAYTEDLTTCRMDNRTGMLWVGRHRVASAFGGRWGPEWELLDDTDGPIGRVQVTYDAGFTVVPRPVQLATAELVKATIQRLRKDATLLSERNGVYDYQRITEEAMADIPYSVRCALAKWRISRAR